MHRGLNSFTSSNKKKGFQFKTNFEIGSPIQMKSDLDIWLTERYSLFLTDSKNQYYSFEIQHLEWELNQLKSNELEINYSFEGLKLNASNLIAQHYSKGVQVIAWNKERLN